MMKHQRPSMHHQIMKLHEIIVIIPRNLQYIFMNPLIYLINTTPLKLLLYVSYNLPTCDMRVYMSASAICMRQLLFQLYNISYN